MDIFHVLEQARRAGQRRFQKEAEAHGFPSIQQYESYLEIRWAETEARIERDQEEKCSRLGITLEELDMQDPQRYVPDCWEPACDCDDHPIPFFCPRTLVDYRSQELMPFLEDQYRVRLDDLTVAPDDKSRRLDEKQLEDLWAFRSPRNSRKLPVWAIGDKVLQQIIAVSSPPDMIGHSFPLRSLSSISPTPTLTREHSTVSDYTVMPDVGVEGDFHHRPRPVQIHQEQQAEQQIISASYEIPQAQSDAYPGQQTSLVKDTGSAPRAKRRRRTLQKANQTAISRIQKTSTRAPRSATSRQTKFYELDRNGIATTLSNR